MRVGGAERSGGVADVAAGPCVFVFMFVFAVEETQGWTRFVVVSWVVGLVVGGADGDLCFAVARVMEGGGACVCVYGD